MNQDVSQVWSAVAHTCMRSRQRCSMLFHNQDEEEVPSESGKDGKDEDGKEEVQKEEATKEKQEDSEKSEGEEKSQDKTEETGSKTDAKVRSGLRRLWS